MIKEVLASVLLACVCPDPPPSNSLPTVESVTTVTMPAAFRFHTAKLQNGYLYVTGNETASSYPCSTRYGQYVWKIDPNTGASPAQWYMPYNNAHADAVVIGGKIVTIGGMVGNGSNVCFSSPWAQSFDLTTNTTALSGTVLSPGVHDPEVIPLTDGNVMTIGGWEGSIVSQQIKVLSPALGLLKSFLLNTARSYRTAHQLSNGNVLAIGGLFYNGSTINNLSTIEIINPTAGTSTLATYQLNTARRYHASVNLNDQIYVFGGTNVNTLGRPPAIGSIEKIDPANGTVTTIGNLQYAREHFQTVKLTKGTQTYIGIFGGQSDVSTPVLQAEIFNPTDNTTSILSGVSWGKADHDRISLCDGHNLYLVGGEDVLTGLGTNTITKITFDSDTVCTKDD